MLNIGGGCNRSGTLPGVRRRAGRLVTVDPSPQVWLDTRADERHQMTLEDFARDHEACFDVAFAVYVLEHVGTRSVSASGRAGAPPGRLVLGADLNRWHYFGLTTWATSRLGVEEWVLRRVRDPDVVQEYHVRTEYRMNTIRGVSRQFEQAGFSQVELRMWTSRGSTSPISPARSTGSPRPGTVPPTPSTGRASWVT